MRDKWDHAFERGVFPERQDVLLLGYLPVAALAAWLAPETVWLPMSKGAARVSGPLNRKRDESARIIAALLSDRLRPHGAAGVAEEIGAHHHHSRVQLMRCYRSESWRPPIALVGHENLAAALAAGKGAVLWVAPFVYGTIVGKMALHDAGVAVAHLSGRRHGFSTSGFGQRFLNPIWTHIERRFLTMRLLMTTAQSPGTLRELVLRVRDNQVISIMMRSAGRRRLTLPFLAGSLTVASGPCALAQRNGATLLPVFTVRGTDGTIVTTIEPPTPMAAGAGAQEAIEQMAVHCVRLLESYVSRWPGQFTGWAMTDPARRS